MIRLMSIVLDVCILVILTLDYLKTREYEAEVNEVRHKLWKLEHKISEVYDYQRVQEHG